MRKNNPTKTKLLIVSSYSPPLVGGPNNMYVLFRDFPDNNFSILTSYHNIDNYSALRGNWMPCRYFFYDNPSATKESRIEMAKITAPQKKTSLATRTKFLAKRFTPFRILIGPFALFLQIALLVKEGRKIISGFNQIMGFSDYGPAIIGSYLLHKISKKPLLLFLFDIYKGNFYFFPGNILANILEKKIFKSARTIIVTNNGTRDFYIKRYGQWIANKIIVIHNSMFPEKYERLRTQYNPKPPYKILFTGGIYWPQLRSLKNLIEAIEKIDIDIALKIYSSNPKSYLEKLGIKEGRRVLIDIAPPEEMPKIQSQADILFLPLSWHTKSQIIIDTATPGKLTDYLISGRPILIHAPASTYLVKYAKENNFAYVVDQENIQTLQGALKKIITDKELAESRIKNARSIFYLNHDGNKNSKILMSFLS